MRRAWLSAWFATLILLCASWSGPASAQTPGDDVVGQIRIEGNERIERATIESYMTLKPGDRFTAEGLDQSLRNLFATGLFDDVRVSRDGNDLVLYSVGPNGTDDGGAPWNELEKRGDFVFRLRGR